MRARPHRVAGLLALATLVAAGSLLVPAASPAAAAPSPGARTSAVDAAPAPASLQPESSRPAAQTGSNGANVSIDTADGNVTVAAGPDQLVTGTAEAEAGTRVSVRVRATGNTTPAFLKAREAVVREDGTWSVAFDFSRQSAGDAFAVTAVRSDPDVRATADGRVVACEGNCSDGTPAPTPTPIPTETPENTDDEGESADRTPVAPPAVSVDHEGETLTVAAGPGQLVTGESDAPAGTALSVRVVSTGDTQPQFIRTGRAVVREDGTWGVTMNFSTQSAGDTFELSVVTPGGTAATVDGRVVACEGDCAEGTPRATPTASPTPTAAPDAGAGASDAGLEAGITPVRRGRTAELSLGFGDADALTVVVGGREAGYELVATVRDADDDGRTTLYVDTAAAGRDGATVTVPDGDAVTVRSEVDLDARLDAGEYDVHVFRGESRDGSRLDVGTLVVEPAGTATPSGTDATAPDETPATVTTRDAARTGESALGAVPDWLVALGAGVVFLLGGAGLALVLLRDDDD